MRFCIEEDDEEHKLARFFLHSMYLLVHHAGIDVFFFSMDFITDGSWLIHNFLAKEVYIEYIWI